MPRTEITRDRLKNHWQYSKAIYIIGIAAAVLLSALVYTMITNRAPANRFSVNIALVRSYSNTDKLEADRAELLARGQAFDDTLQAVSFIGVAYEGNPETDDTYASQLYTVQLYAADNDIFIQNEKLTRSLIEMGGCKPLEEMDEFISFTARYPDIGLLRAAEPGTGETDEEGNVLSEAIEHVYAIDISTLTGFIDRQAMDNRGMYACLLSNSANPETSMYVLGQMFDLLTPAAAEADGSGAENE